MEKLKSFNFRLILFILMSLMTVFFVGCSGSAKINYNRLNSTDTANEITYNWYVNDTKIDDFDNNQYFAEYEYNSTTFAISLKYQIDGGEELTLDGQYISITNLEGNATEVKEVGAYIVIADTSTLGEDVVVANLNINISKVEISTTWTLPNSAESLEGYDVSTYKIKYVEGADLVGEIFAKTQGNYNASESASYIIEFGNSVINTITEVGEYILNISGYSEDTYNLSNEKIRLIIAEEIELAWEIDGANSTQDNNFEIEYRAEDLYNKILITNQITKYNLVVVDSNLLEVAEVKNVGKYTCTIVSDYYYFINNGKTLDIKPKKIYVVADEIKINYLDKVPNISELTYKVYSSYDVSVMANNVLLSEDWADNIRATLNYKDITRQEIITEVANWSYDIDGVLEKNFIIELESTVPKADNYVIENISGKLQITLKKVEVRFIKDNNQATTKTREYYQTQTVPLSEVSKITANFNEGRALTSWYKSGQVVDFENCVLTENTTFNIYSVYYIYYMDTDDKANAKTIATVPYDNINNVSYPKSSHITSGNYSSYTTLPSRYAYSLYGWIDGQDSQNKPMQENAQATNKSNTVRDIYLYPYFEPFKYKNIIIQRQVIEKQIVNDNGEIEKIQIIEKEKEIQFTIEDYDKNEYVSLEVWQVEGYQFLGWYYNGSILSDNRFKFSDFITSRDKVHSLYQDIMSGKVAPIVLETKYEIQKCVITLMVGDKTLTTLSLEMGDSLDKNYLSSLIDRKFGYIYIMGEVPSTVTNTAHIIRVTEFPLLYVIAGVIVLAVIVIIIVRQTVIKRRNDIEKSKLDNIFNRLEK